MQRFCFVVVVVVAVVVMSPLVDTTCRVLVPFLAWEGSPAHAATSWVILTTHQTQELKGMKSSRRVYIYWVLKVHVSTFAAHPDSVPTAKQD